MNKLITSTIVILFGLCLRPENVYSLIVGTYSSPPFSMHEDGEDIGMSTEAVRDLLANSGITDYKIISYPLARGLVELNNGSVDLFYPYVAELNADLDKVTLIGPISKYRVALFVRKDYAGNISLDHMRGMALSAERGSIADNFLTNSNIRVEASTQEVSCLKMALANRVAACAIGTLPGMYVSAINNMYQDFKFVETDVYVDMYIALSKNIPRETMLAIRTAFDTLMQEDYFYKQQIDYEAKFKIFIESLA